MNEIKIDGIIENKKLSISDKKELQHFISSIENGKVEITIRKKRKVRSLPQNNYYWGVVIPSIQKAIHDLGMRMTFNETENWIIEYLTATDSEFVHTFLKHKFIERMKVDESTGEIIEIKKPSTKNLTKDEFGDYLNRVIQFANETLEIYIPSSNEY